MQVKTTYKGYINGVYGIYCGFKPEGLIVEEEIPIYYPDEGKVLVKDGEEYTAVVLQEGETIEEYTEVEKAEDEEETENG